MMLIYPVAGTDTNTPSYRENTATAPLSRAGMLWFVDKVTRSQADLQDPRLDIVGKARLQGLPPTPIVSAEHDPLRSESETPANRRGRPASRWNAAFTRAPRTTSSAWRPWWRTRGRRRTSSASASATR